MSRAFFIVLMAAVLAACSSGPTHSNKQMSARVEGLELCPQERPQVCTMEYRPTCAHLGRSAQGVLQPLQCLF